MWLKSPVSDPIDNHNKYKANKAANDKGEGREMVSSAKVMAPK